MDRNVVIATVLIMGILLIWMYVVTPPPSELQPVAPDTTQVVESIGVEEEPDIQGVTALPPAASDTTLDAASVGTERRITVDTDLYTAELSTKGATIVRFRLKDCKHSQTLKGEGTNKYPSCLHKLLTFIQNQRSMLCSQRE